MKTNLDSCDRWVRGLTILLILSFVLVPLAAFAAGGIVDQSIDALYNLRDQNQASAMKSVKSVAEAMQNGPPSDPGAGQPWTRDDLEKIRSQNATLLKQNNDLAHYQQEMFKNDTDLLQKLPPNDPRHAQVEAHRQKIAEQLSDTRKQQKLYRGKLGEANSAIDRWRQANDPSYVSPKKTSAPPVGPVEMNQPSQPSQLESSAERPTINNPPSSDSGDGSTGNGPNNVTDNESDNGLDNELSDLKKKEAEKEAAARTLGQQRKAAINEYLDDPSPENRAAADELRHQLDGTVGELNGIRDQVDQLQGTSREPVGVPSANAIAVEHRSNQAASGNSQSGGGFGESGTDIQQHSMSRNNPSGTSFQDVATPQTTGTGSTGNTAANKSSPQIARTPHSSHSGMRQRTGSNVGSSDGHGGGINKSNQQTMGQKRYRGAAAGAMPNQQNMGQMKNRRQQQQQQQRQQQRRRRNDGY